MIDIILDPLKVFINPSQRIYWLFLGFSLLIAYYLYLKQKKFSSFYSFIGGNQAWLSSSAKVDYLWLIIGFWINLFLIAPYIISQIQFNMLIIDFLYGLYVPNSFGLSETTILVLYTFTIIVLLDISYYFIHYAMHKYKFLWDCHKFHHSATALNPITLYRTHPVEYVLFALQKVIVLGVVTSFFVYQFGMIVKPIEFYGMGIGALVFAMLGSNLRHSQVEFKYFSWLENILISPYMHQIHHSSNPKEHHSNFGGIFSIWDRIFGTINKSNDVKTKLVYGIEGYSHTSIIHSMFLPIINLQKRIRK